MRQPIRNPQPAIRNTRSLRVALEGEARLLHAATRAGLVSHEKATAALLVYAQLRKLGAAFSFGQFMVDRGLLSQVALEGLERNLAVGEAAPARTISRVGDYELLDLLGDGTTGSVFRARQLSRGRTVAVKVLSPRLAEDEEGFKRFLDEARVWAKLRHPHIVEFHRLACCEGLYYIAQEYAPGGSLRRLLAQSGGRLEQIRALELARQAAEGLAAAHAAGLLHRDVKPENVLLDARGRAKLTDLGIAVRRAESRGTAPGQPADEFWGTPEYLAPEVISGHRATDPRSDLYSLGAMLFEMLAGRPPFQGRTPGEILRQHLEAPPPSLRQLRPGLAPQTAALVARLLAKDPAARFPHAQAVVAALNVAIATLRPRRAQRR
jgi:serine/threonine-protein kinase